MPYPHLLKTIREPPIVRQLAKKGMKMFASSDSSTDTKIQRRDHLLVMQGLQLKHKVLLDLIENRPVHFTDIPVHGNIGDLLIMKGTLEFFRKSNIRCEVKAGYFNYSPKWLKRTDVLLFQGGGNLGDLYPGPQLFRERCVAEAITNRIIILPQTIHFERAENRRRCEEIFSSHPDLHICVRDEKSFEQAHAMSDNVYLLPDMAHQLWPISRTRPIIGERLGISRVDGETSGARLSGCDFVTDWPELVGPTTERLIRAGHRLASALHALKADRWSIHAQEQVWLHCVDKLVANAIALFSSYACVRTDRLHGHILACLMNIENEVLDNSYGKNATYVDAWTGKSVLVSKK
jgi:pyruvyl transferase EpsO